MAYSLAEHTFGINVVQPDDNDYSVMSKRNLLNLFLLVFIFALVALVIYEPGKEKAITPPTLTNINADDIYHITIKRHQADKTEQELVFEKTTTGWILIKPYQHAANSFRIDSVLKLLSAVSLSQNNIENLNQQQFGLVNPQASITFNNKTTIVFGNNKSLKNHRYVKTGTTLHLIADTFLYQLTAKAESYIDHKLLPENSKIVNLSLPDLKLEKLDTKWQLTPKTDDFSADAVNQLINEWQLSQSYDLKVDNPQPNTQPDITVKLMNSSTLRFKMTQTKDSFNLLNIDNGIRYILSKDRSNKLLNLSGIEHKD